MTDYEIERSEWLSIQEASQLLRVSSSTLRRWTEKKQVPVSKTPGGHRRYSAKVIQELAQAMPSQSLAELTPTPPVVADWSDASSRIGQQPWYPQFAPAKTAKEMRGMGQRLLGLLIQYVTRRNEDSRFLQESR